MPKITREEMLDMVDTCPHLDLLDNCPCAESIRAALAEVGKPEVDAEVTRCEVEK
jgi:hypothetical protein